MEKQISRKPIPYVLEDDRDSPEEKQVVFWIIPLKGEEASDVTADYLDQVRAQAQSGHRGSRRRVRQADRRSWLSAVEKIENYPPSDDIPELLALADETNGRIASVSDETGLLMIRKDMLGDQVQEIFNARSNFSTLEAAEKKDSSS